MQRPGEIEVPNPSGIDPWGERLEIVSTDGMSAIASMTDGHDLSGSLV
jgi:hypothetical protein